MFKWYLPSITVKTFPHHHDTLWLWLRVWCNVFVNMWSWCKCLLQWPTTVTSKQNAHFKFKSLTANSNGSQQITNPPQQITNRSHQIQIAHSKYILLTSSTNPSQQIKISYKKFKSFTASTNTRPSTGHLQLPLARGATRIRMFLIREVVCKMTGQTWLPLVAEVILAFKITELSQGQSWQLCPFDWGRGALCSWCMFLMYIF